VIGEGGATDLTLRPSTRGCANDDVLVWRETTIPLTDLSESIGPSPTRVLIRSVAEHGVLQPVLLGELEVGGYVVIDGNRRIAAARLAGLEAIPARVTAIDPETAAVLTMTANAVRGQNPAAEAAAITTLATAGFTETEIMARTGMTIQTIRKRLRTARGLIPEFRQLLQTGETTTPMAGALAKLPASEQRALFDRCQAGERLTWAVIRRVRAARRDTAFRSIDGQLPNLPEAGDRPRVTLTRTVRELQGALAHLPPDQRHVADRALSHLATLLQAQMHERRAG